MPWGMEHIIFCEVMHWGLGFFVGLSTYLLTLSVVSTSGIKAHFHLGNFSTFLLCMVPAVCMSVVTHVLEDYWIALF